MMLHPEASRLPFFWWEGINSKKKEPTRRRQGHLVNSVLLAVYLAIVIFTDGGAGSFIYSDPRRSSGRIVEMDGRRRRPIPLQFQWTARQRLLLGLLGYP